MPSYFWPFFLGVWIHWTPILTGGVFSIIMLILNKPIRRRHVAWIMLIAMFVSCFWAWRDEYTSAEWRGMEVVRLSAVLANQQSHVNELESALSQKDRPIILQPQTAPEILKLMAQLVTQASQAKSAPRKRALHLSTDILTFWVERTKSEPPFPAPLKRAPEELKKLIDEWDQNHRAWSKDTESEYLLRFGPRISSTVEDFRSAGMNVDKSVEPCILGGGVGTSIEYCGSQIGGLAGKLPQ